jgi:hypothetical protein
MLQNGFENDESFHYIQVILNGVTPLIFCSFAIPLWVVIECIQSGCGKYRSEYKQ